MIPILGSSLLKSAKSIISFGLTNQFHALAAPSQLGGLLKPNIIDLVPSCGFKVKGFLKRRCKDCYFVRRFDRLFVICNTHRRHKQMAVQKDPKNTWILTHATQSKIRPW